MFSNTKFTKFLHINVTQLLNKITLYRLFVDFIIITQRSASQHLHLSGTLTAFN